MTLSPNADYKVMDAFPLMEHYYTVQGEGYNTGKACYFIRLGGCDVGCVWCDVKESWDAAKYKPVPVASLLNLIKAAGASRSVITGGEPLMYDLSALTTILRGESIKVYLETSGAYPLSGSWDWICVSPKKFKAPLPEVVSKADELKVVVYNKSDFDWAEKHRQMVPPACKLFLQPEYSVFDKMIPEIISYVKLHPEWSISLQTHKFMNIQ